MNDERQNQTVSAGIQKTYAYHQPSDSALLKITQLRRAFSELDALIVYLTSPSKDKSTAITFLETAGMWAIKAVVLNDADSVIDS